MHGGGGGGQDLLRRETGEVTVHHDDPAVRQHLAGEVLHELLLAAEAVEEQGELALQQLPPTGKVLLERRLQPSALVHVSHGEPTEQLANRVLVREVQGCQRGVGLGVFALHRDVTAAAAAVGQPLSELRLSLGHHHRGIVDALRAPFFTLGLAQPPARARNTAASASRGVPRERLRGSLRRRPAEHLLPLRCSLLVKLDLLLGHRLVTGGSPVGLALGRPAAGAGYHAHDLCGRHLRAACASLCMLGRGRKDRVRGASI